MITFCVSRIGIRSHADEVEQTISEDGEERRRWK